MSDEFEPKGKQRNVFGVGDAGEKIAIKNIDQLYDQAKIFLFDTEVE